MIIGGHSHTFIDKPCVVSGIPIVQAGTGTDLIGRFDLMIDTDNNCIDSFTWTTIPIRSETCPRDQVPEDLIMNYKDQVDKKYGRIITRFARDLRITYNRTSHEFESFDYKNEPLDDQALYTVGVPAYHYSNLKDFLDISPEECAENAAIRTLSTSTRDVIEGYLIAHSNLDRRVEGRMVFVD